MWGQKGSCGDPFGAVDEGHHGVGVQAPGAIGYLQRRLGGRDRAELRAIEVESEPGLGTPLAGQELADGGVEDGVVESEAETDAGADEVNGHEGGPACA